MIMNFKSNNVHPEEDPNVNEYNNNITNITKDLASIDEKIINITNKIKNLLDFSKIKINEIQRDLLKEREIQDDINILCNHYTGFLNAITLTENSFNGNLNFINNNLITCPIIKQEKVEYDIDSISGNGYEGNKYVIKDGAFIDNILNSSNRDYLKDNNLVTYFEYSRISCDKKNNEYPIDFNYDSNDVVCSIELSSKKDFNIIKIFSDKTDIILNKILYAKDNDIYEIDKEYNIAFNDKTEKYQNQKYIYNSGIFDIKSTNKAKVILKSNTISNDTIGYTRTYVMNNNIYKKIQIEPNAKRKAIKINSIELYRNEYSSGSVISKNLITEPVNKIALYANEYVYKDFSIDNNVKYYFIINGIEHEIIPINSHRNGYKIVKYKEYKIESDNTIYINENIKSLQLKIVLSNPNAYYSPYISDVKILIGDDI